MNDSRRMPDITIIEDDLSGEAIRDLVRLHLAGMHAESPPDKVHALPIEALRAPRVTFWSAWVEGRAAGMGAMRQLSADHGELKSMRVAPEFRRQGVGEAMLRHLLGEARRRGYARVSLETGRTDAFRPAFTLYRKYGFVECAAFADYVLDDFSQCMTLVL